MEHENAPQRRENLLNLLAQVVAQLTRQGERLACLGRRHAFGREQRGRPLDLKLERLPGARLAGWQTIQLLDAFVQMRERLGVGRPLGSAPGRLEPILDRLPGQAGACVVVSQQLRLGLDALGEPRFSSLATRSWYC